MDASPTNSQPERSELDLIRRAQTGDISAFEPLVRHDHDSIYGFMYGLTGDRNSAEELTQEVFVKAWKALRNFRAEAQFSLWIHRIAFLRASRFCKKQGEKRSAVFEEFDSAVKQSESYQTFSSKGSVLRKMSLSEFQKKMNAALGALSEKNRAVVILHDVQGMAFSEVATVLSGSEKVIHSHLDAAYETLQAALAELGRELDIPGLLALKRYERPNLARAEKNRLHIMRAIRTAHTRPSLHHFPDKSMGWMFAQPRYGVAALFIIFLGLHLLDRPLPDTPLGSSTVQEPVMGIETNAVSSPVPLYSTLISPDPFIQPNP